MLDALLGPVLMAITLQSPAAPAAHPGIFLPQSTPQIEHALLPLTRVDADASALLRAAGDPPTAELLGERDVRLASELLAARPDHANDLLPVTRTKPSRTSLLLD